MPTFRLPPPPERPAFEVMAEPSQPVPMAFADLLGPVSVAAFCSDYWARHPLLVRRTDPGFYDGVFSVRELESYFSLRGFYTDQTVTLRAPDKRVRRHMPSAGDVYAHLAQGWSLHLRESERFLAPDAPLRALYADIQRRLQHPGDSLSCFLAPPNSVLLGPHWDETEVFTLQISGSKTWRFYHQLLTDESKFCEPGETDEPSREFTLHAGDLLYHPRGLVHEVFGDDTTSLSVSVIIMPMTYKTVLSRVFDALADRPEFIAQLPAGALLGADVNAGLIDAVARRSQIIGQVADAMRPQDHLDGFANDLLKRLPPSTSPHLSASMVARQLPPTTRVVPRAGAWRVTVRDDRAILTIAGGDQFAGPASLAPVLATILSRTEPVSLAALHPDLDGPSRLTVGRRLLEMGAITTASS